MKRRMVSIAFLVLLVLCKGNNNALAQTVNIDRTLQVFNLIFDTCNFDSRYYVDDSKPTFIVLKEGPVIDIADSLGFVNDVLQLANGNRVVINSKGWMFMANLVNYLKLTGIKSEKDDMTVEFELCGFDGFEEESLGSIAFSLSYRNDQWRLMQKKVEGRQKK